MSGRVRAAGKILYGALFVLVLPVLLVLWARATERVVRAPAWGGPGVGWAMASAGTILVVWGWGALWQHGGGLPMNAFPPPRYVDRGPYRLVAHPIYVGFVGACFGVSIATGSASGLWLVSPTIALGAVALVLGYEGRALRERFGEIGGQRWISLCPAGAEPPSSSDRLLAFACAVLPSGVVHWVALSKGSTASAFHAAAPLAAFVLLGTGPWASRSRQDLRAFEVCALLSTAVAGSFVLASPFAPSLPAVWLLLFADAWASRAPRARPLLLGLAVCVGAATMGTGERAPAEVLVGFFTYAVAANAGRAWERLRRGAERVANSWREARIGPVRIINHGAWGGLATFLAVSIAATLAGPGHVTAVLVASFASMVGATLWAQGIEGSPALARPYGFYGGLLGVCAGALAAPLFGNEVWPLLGAFAVAGPFAQATGRMRCLVQGCCHGRPSTPAVGIRYLHPTSRVCRLAKLRDVAVHPTPLYSILWNAVTAVVVGRLWFLHAAVSLVGGSFLLLNGLGRFVEESYRGEPQTPIFAGLRLYQWVALCSVVAGGLVTALGGGPDAPAPVFAMQNLVAATAFGLLTWFATGVDFPESNRRFSRLT
jgi:protein-S-isoprenylcysteine O-methyltransferase Ste14